MMKTDGIRDYIRTLTGKRKSYTINDEKGAKENNLERIKINRLVERRRKLKKMSIASAEMDFGTHVRNYFVVFCAELTGSAFLMYFGCIGVNSENLSKLEAPLVWGFTITAIIMMFGHITRGHFNPCVTTCAIILGLISPFTALIYYLAEILGATLGFWLIYVTIPPTLILNGTEPDVPFCLTNIHSDMKVYQGLICEFIATSMLIYAVCSAWDPRNSVWSDSVALKFGSVVAAIVFGLGPYTGASINPARSFAPAFIHNRWDNHWAYWVAPLSGAIVTTFVYKYLYLVDVEVELKAKEKLVDQLRQGSLYSKKEDPDSLIPKSSLCVAGIDAVEMPVVMENA